MSEAPRAKDIVKENKVYCDIEKEVRHFNGGTLGYVTPVTQSAKFSIFHAVYFSFYVCCV